MHTRLVSLVLAAGILGCAGDRLTAPSEQTLPNRAPAFMAAEAGSGLAVLTRNMYVGAPVEPILAETDPNLIPVRVAEAWATLVDTDFPTRAAALADEIARTKPHLVGLQEVSLLRTQTPGDAAFGGTDPATTVAYDFLATLLAELSARGLTYVVAAQVWNIDVEVPRLDGFSGGVPQFTDVRLNDSDVILARSDVGLANAAAGNYTYFLGPPYISLAVPRGWAAVDATVDGRTYRFVNTHLEAEAETIRFAQAYELMGVLSTVGGPVILVGDFNSGPGRPPADGGQATYDLITAFGFGDAWMTKRPATQDGFTCCHAGDLSNRHPNLTQRIDVVFSRGVDGLLANAALVGSTTGDWAARGVWPSDHAGVTARWVVPAW